MTNHLMMKLRQIYHMYNMRVSHYTCTFVIQVQRYWDKYIHACMCAWICTHALAHTHTHIHIHVYMHTRAHAHTCMHTHTHACTHTHAHTRMHTHTCTHTHTHAHMYMHIHMHTCTFSYLTSCYCSRIHNGQLVM